jgi:crotonobetainyl-CoA:carnitine CoA-transferase CaiB-like acyl-CoA transferase
MMLRGVRVLELAAGIAGPLAGLRLGELGAAVTKVERLPGDWLRGAAPAAPGGSDSATFVSLNRGKLGVAVGDLAAAAPLLTRAVDRSDVVLTDWSADDVAAAGLAEARDRADAGDSALVWTQVTGFGDRGPLAGAPGSELVAQAAAGYTRYLGTHGEPALRLGADVGAAASGILAVQGVLASLLWRRRGGTGQRVAVSRLGTLLALKSIQLTAQGDPDDFQGPRVGGANYPPEHGWRAADGYLTFSFGGSVGETGRAGWTEFVDEIGLGWMRDDPRFSDDPTGRLTTGLGPRARELRAEYEKEFTNHPAAEIVDLVRRHGGAAAVYADHRQVLATEQLRALDVVRETDEATRVTAFPARFSRVTTEVRAHVPRVGEHTRQVAGELGLPATEIDELVAAGALGVPAEGEPDAD